MLAASNWRDEATVRRGEWEWHFASRRGRRLIGTLSTDPPVSGSGERARFFAHQTSMWRGTWDIWLEGVPYRLGPRSFWRGSRVLERAGQDVGVTGTAGTWSRRVTLDVADDVPIDHQIFLLWMAFILQRRANNAAAGAAVAGGAAAAGGGA